MEGVRVLEVASWTYVPAAGAVLAEWGADVIKIEHPESGDPQRGLVNSGLVPSGPGGINHMIELPNRGKRSVALDLKSEEGHELLLKIAEKSDVFLTSFLPPLRRSLHIEVEDIRAANPNIIYVRGSGQGQHGPEADKGGFDGASFWYRAVADIVSDSDQHPIGPPGPAFGDMLGGMTIAGGICAALYHRQRTGEALVVDNSLLSTAMWATAGSSLSAGLFGVSKLPRGDRSKMFNPLVNTYRTGDGRYLSLMMLQADKFWPELVRTLGHPELADDPRFAEGAARFENREACIALLDSIFETKTLAEWSEKLAAMRGGGVWAPVQQQGELLNDPQVAANDFVREVKHRGGSTYRIVASPIRFNDESPDLVAAPDHGEHTDEVLQELGYDMDQIIELKIKGAIL
jgi:crotonobetainyl-CoA:carnitine CoA-transferase CaiB-like acyl-CoA transferase